MWEAIRKNNRRSYVLITLMGIVLVVLGFAIGATVDPQMGGAFGALIAVGIWFILCLVAMFSGDRLLLASSSAHKIEKKDAPKLWNVIEEMTIASGLGKMPDVYVIEDHVPNAFAVGKKPEKAAVAVTTGLLKRLNRDELQGVVAHEIGHIRNLDVRFMTIASVMLGSIVVISEFFLRSLFYGGRRRSSRSSKGGGQAQLAILAAAILLAILAPILARMLYFACSRQREYLADASAARFTRYPAGLASALEKISKRAVGKRKVSKALAPLYIVNPLQGPSAWSLFSTHPPTEKRIQILRSMGGLAGYMAYEQAYKQVHGERKRCIDSQTIESDEDIAVRSPVPDTEVKKDAVQRAQEVGDLIDSLVRFLIIPCACGVRIKVPPESKQQKIPCPRCGRKHSISEAKQLKSGNQEGNNLEPMQYRRQGTGWESVECSCGKRMQLSPGFQGKKIKCSNCDREIEIVDS